VKSFITVWLTVVAGDGKVFDGHRDFVLAPNYRTDETKRLGKILKLVALELGRVFLDCYRLQECYVTCHQVERHSANGTPSVVVPNDLDESAWTWVLQGQCEEGKTNG